MSRFQALYEAIIGMEMPSAKEEAVKAVKEKFRVIASSLPSDEDIAGAVQLIADSKSKGVKLEDEVKAAFPAFKDGPTMFLIKWLREYYKTNYMSSGMSASDSRTKRILQTTDSSGRTVARRR